MKAFTQRAPPPHLELSFYTESLLNYRNHPFPAQVEDFPPAPTTMTEISQQLRHSTRTTEKHPYLLSLQILVSDTHLCGVLRIRSLWELVGNKTKHVSHGTWISGVTKKSRDQHQGQDTEGKIKDEVPWLYQVLNNGGEEMTFSFKLHSMWSCWKKQLWPKIGKHI